MKYHKLIELYKKNQLDARQTEQVAADIEKHEAISEYLFDQEDNSNFLHVSGREKPENTEKSDPDRKNDIAFANMVNRKIRWAFFKLAACTAIFTLAAALFVVFFLPKAVDRFYYDPSTSNGTYGNQISLDYCVYTDLCMPGYQRDNVSVQRRGYGVYDIMILPNISYHTSVSTVTGKIERGRLTLYDPNALQHPAGNAFAWFQMEGNPADSLSDLIEKKGKTNYCFAGSRQEAAKALADLEEQTVYVAYVSLDRMMPYDEFMEFLSGLNESQLLESIWCAVCTKDMADSAFRADNLGFQCVFSSNHALDWDKKTYPDLLLWNEDSADAASFTQSQNNVLHEDTMKTHFTSMLRYMADQEAFLQMQKPFGAKDAQEYRNAADYVEKHGLMVYGFAGIGDKKALLGLNQEKEVYEISTQRLR